MTPTYYNLGDSLRGERIAAQARKITNQKTIQLSSRHKGTFLSLKYSAFCVIEAPLKSVQKRRGS